MSEAESEEQYTKLLHSGMFWELHPELTGVWEKDQEGWISIQRDLEKFRATFSDQKI